MASPDLFPRQVPRARGRQRTRGDRGGFSKVVPWLAGAFLAVSGLGCSPDGSHPDPLALEAVLSLADELPYAEVTVQPSVIDHVVLRSSSMTVTSAQSTE